MEDRAFASAAPILWNKLPDNLKTETDTSSFIKSLKTYLFLMQLYEDLCKAHRRIFLIIMRYIRYILSIIIIIIIDRSEKRSVDRGKKDFHIHLIRIHIYCSSPLDGDDDDNNDDDDNDEEDDEE